MRARKQMSRKISVVIPTYNEEAYIGRCLNSLVNQTLNRDAYEIVVVDGGSADRTVEIAREYADIVIMQQSKGVGGARNDGVALSSGEIVAMTDADIVLPDNWLERIYDDFSGDGVVAVYGPIIPIESRFKYRLLIGMFNKLVHIAAYLKVFYATLGSNTAILKDVFERIGGYTDMSAGDDYEIARRLKEEGIIKYDPELYVWFSMRRMEKYGVIRALYIWAMNLWASKRGTAAKVNYTRQIYRYNRYR